MRLLTCKGTLGDDQRHLCPSPLVSQALSLGSVTCGWCSCDDGSSGDVSVPAARPEKKAPKTQRRKRDGPPATYYIKTIADDVRSAMAKLEQNVGVTQPQDTHRTLNQDFHVVPTSVN